MEQRTPSKIFLAVERALFLREIDMKISAGKSGLFWLLFEPFLQVFLFISIRVAIISRTGADAGASAYDPAIFMAVGFIAYNLFKNILNSSSGAFVANRGLFVYKQVKPIDALLARAVVNLFLTILIAIMFLIVGYFLGYTEILPKNPLMFLFAVLWLVLFSIGIGILVATGNTFFVSVGMFVKVISFALLIFSAVFYPIVSLPPLAQKLLLYNPLVHFMEMIHANYLYGVDDRFVDYRYMLYWTLVPLFVGLWLYRKLEKRIISS